jgi:hypothetical protein
VLVCHTGIGRHAGFIDTHVLDIVVFLTGAAVLIVEVLATRILAPYFGNTIYTISSI